ncbi:MAG: S1-like domain-containing RNA-binding protein [Legionellaceae bacterium]|nr:S1-like domain-containing RNA-binding protein [Legionellaceae bacterium]
MINVGKFNKLKVIKEVAFGVYLDGQDLGDILLPNKYVPQNTQLLDSIEVFIYYDSEDKIIATTQRPLAKLGDCAYLKAIDINRVGAFLNWGLDKDMLVPMSEQLKPMEKNKSYLVYIKQDNQGRLIASSKINYFLDKSLPKYKIGDEVDLLIAETTQLGNKVIVNNSHWGLIYSDDIFQTLSYGKKMRGYIKNVRDDGKIDISLRKSGQDNIEELAKKITRELQRNDGFLALHDKSPSFEIKRSFGESKGNFKKAIGLLYKNGVISIQEDGIQLKD